MVAVYEEKHRHAHKGRDDKHQALVGKEAKGASRIEGTGYPYQALPGDRLPQHQAVAHHRLGNLVQTEDETYRHC